MVIAAAPAPVGIWENTKYYLNEPKLWAVVGAVGIVAGIILKVELVAIFALGMLVNSLFSWYDQRQSIKGLQELKQQERDYGQWLTQLVRDIAPRGVVNNAEDIDLTASPRDVLNNIHAAIERYLKPHERIYKRFMDDFWLLQAQFNGFVDRGGYNARVERIMRRLIFHFYEEANRDRPNYNELYPLFEENIRRGMGFF